MAEIATFRCDNYRCRMTVRMCKDFPVWHAHAPSPLRAKLYSSDSEKEFVVRYRTEVYCRACRFLIADPTSAACPRCHGATLVADQTGMPCVQCTQGTFAMVHLTVR